MLHKDPYTESEISYAYAKCEKIRAYKYINTSQAVDMRTKAAFAYTKYEEFDYAITYIIDHPPYSLTIKSFFK